MTPLSEEGKVYMEGYPQKMMAIALGTDHRHVLIVPVQIDGPGAEPKIIGGATDVTQGFWTALLGICTPGETTPVYGGGKHVMNITVDVIPPELQTPVPAEHLDAVPEFKNERKPLDIKDL